MYPQHLDLLRCPESKEKLKLEVTEQDGERVKEGKLIAEKSGKTYPIIKYIPRFVDLSNYADSFALEWQIHSRTQYDSESGFPLSETRFFEETQWPRKLKGEIILEVGSGSGRFTEWALSTDATVVSLDYSGAVDANYASNGENPNLLLIQASIFDMPFEEDFADRAYCFGMLQHTPDPKAAFMAVPPYIKPGGHFVTDIYRYSLRTQIGTRYLFRIFTKKMDPEKGYKFVVNYVNFWWPVVKLLRKIPFDAGIIFTRKALNIADHAHAGLRGAPDDILKTWAYLNTFDRNSARYEYPQTLSTFKKWHEEAGLEEIDVKPGYNGIDARARRPGKKAASKAKKEAA